MDKVNRKYFVGGIPSGATYEEVQEHFIQFGDVKKVSFSKSKGHRLREGYCFVKFWGETDTERMKTTSFQGRYLEICPTVKKNKLEEITQSKYKRTIFIKGIPSALDEQRFESIFVKFGEIKKSFLVDKSSQRVQTHSGKLSKQDKKSLEDDSSKIKSQISKENPQTTDKIINAVNKELTESHFLNQTEGNQMENKPLRGMSKTHVFDSHTNILHIASKDGFQNLDQNQIIKDQPIRISKANYGLVEYINEESAKAAIEAFKNTSSLHEFFSGWIFASIEPYSRKTTDSRESGSSTTSILKNSLTEEGTSSVRKTSSFKQLKRNKSSKDKINKIGASNDTGPPRFQVREKHQSLQHLSLSALDQSDFHRLKPCNRAYHSLEKIKRASIGLQKQTFMTKARFNLEAPLTKSKKRPIRREKSI